MVHGQPEGHRPGHRRDRIRHGPDHCLPLTPRPGPGPPGDGRRGPGHSRAALTVRQTKGWPIKVPLDLRPRCLYSSTIPMMV
jgi:hypothetical protein